jgi:hypothetical protein
MTAPSETFYEDVRDLAKDYFGDNIPEYDEIKIENKWKGIWVYQEFPKNGIIEYFNEGKPVAKVRFKVESEWDGEDLIAYPVYLVLELPGMEPIHEPQSLIDDLKDVQQKIRNLRDNQEIVPCPEDGGCICNRFDYVIDAVDTLIDEIEGKE